MTKIICRVSDCVHWDDGICLSEQVTYDLENGCLTYKVIEDILLEEDEGWENAEMVDDEPLEWDGDEDSLPDEDDEGWDA